jgi:hypothetical protein
MIVTENYSDNATHHQLTNDMEQSHYLEINSRSASQDIPYLLWNWKSITVFTTAHSGICPGPDEPCVSVVYIMTLFSVAKTI